MLKARDDTLDFEILNYCINTPQEEHIATPEQFQTVFAQLKGILQPFAKQLTIQTDEPDNYSLATPYIPSLKKEMFFGAVQIKKNYVSYHLMPVYVFPSLLDDLSPTLKKRMQGKSCFNFKAVD